MGVVALERGIPAFFDNSRGRITTRQDEGDGADLPQVPQETALKIPHWVTVHGKVADVLVTGRLRYLLNPNRLGEGILGDESSMLRIENPGKPVSPLTPNQEMYRHAYKAALQKP